MKKTFLALVFTLGITALAIPSSAYAVGGLGACASAATTAETEGAVSGLIAVPVNDQQVARNVQIQTTKECLLDGIVIALREAMIATITQNIVTWINNGFDGGPGYVTNLGDFLGQVADNTALDFLRGTELGLLCSPFALEVRLALVLSYTSSFSRHSSCTLGDVAGTFLSGDFINGGGWRSLFRLSTGFQNNPYSAYLQAQDELNVRIASRTGEEKQLLDYGGGIFSKGKCTNLPTVVSQPLGEVGEEAPPSASDVSQSRSGCESLGGSWQIVTPGAIINDSLSQSLTSGLKQLELADEIDEIIGALLAQVMQKALTSVDGLGGLSNRSSSSATSGRSYLEALLNESEENYFEANKQGLVAQINASIQTEDQYRAILSSITVDYTEAQDGFDTASTCVITTNALQTPVVDTTNSEAGIQATLQTLAERSAEADAAIEILFEIALRAQDATTSTELTLISNEYAALLASDDIHTEEDVTLLINESASIHQPTLSGYRQQASDNLSACGG